MTPLPISACTLTTALGAGKAATLAALQAGRSGLAPLRFREVPLPTWTGEVAGVDAVALPHELIEFDCRNNRLAWLGLQQDGFVDQVAAARRRWGSARIGVFLGTSTSGLLHTELAYRRRGADGALPPDFHYAATQNTYSLTEFVARALGIDGPSWVVSTACSSSAKVFGNAQRLIAAGLIDAAIVGGVDSLCLTTLYGFNSLELLSPEICRPWDAARSGLSVGEAAAFALVERAAEAVVGPGGEAGDDANGRNDREVRDNGTVRNSGAAHDNRNAGDSSDARGRRSGATAIDLHDNGPASQIARSAAISCADRRVDQPADLPARPPCGWLLGVGESNDGYHMSSPHPEGAGAAAAMRAAIEQAGLQPTDIDYINLHGTATPSNDAAEDRAVASVFGRTTPCSSTKGATGHTLGAAGGVEAVIALLAIESGLMPGGLNLKRRDADLQSNYLSENRHQRVRHVLSNSFGFGGSNASLVLGGAEADDTRFGKVVPGCRA